jgi:hypothetical protein
MKALMYSTDAIVDMRNADGVVYQARVWEGMTDAGVAFTAYIAMAQVRSDADCSEFERDLRESPAPNASTRHAIDLRSVI